MHITFITPYAALTGGNRVIGIYAEKLRSKGHDVFILSQPARKASLKKKIKGLFSNKGWLTNIEDLPEPFFDIEGVEHRILDKPRPVMEDDLPDADVIIATIWFTAKWVAELPPSKGTKFYFVQGHEVNAPFYEKVAQESYQYPLCKIVVSRWLLNIMVEKYGDNNCNIVPNAVDFKHFTSIARRKNKPLTIGFIYTTNPVKNVKLAIEAVELAKERIRNLKVVAFGYDAPGRELALPDWVEFYNRPGQEDIPRIFAECDAWLFTSCEEGFGLPILEAMACRTPVIATPAGAAPELITCENGVLIESDVNSIVQKIIDFNAMSNSQWVKYSKNAFDTARAYSWDDAVDNFETILLKEVISEDSKFTL